MIHVLSPSWLGPSVRRALLRAPMALTLLPCGEHGGKAVTSGDWYSVLFALVGLVLLIGSRLVGHDKDFRLTEILLSKILKDRTYRYL